MAGIIAFKFEPRAIPRTGFENIFNILEGIAEHDISGILKIRWLPIMFEFLEPIKHREQPEIHRPHIQGRDFRREFKCRLQTFLNLHRRTATGCQVQDRIRGLFQPRQETGKHVRVLGRTAVFRITGMKVQDRRPGFGGLDGLFGDLVRGNRQMRRHAGRMNATGNGTGDDDLA